MRVVIVGAGAIGASMAYVLSSRGAEVTVVERTAVAAAASGKAGGFLALDWCDGGPIQQLARRSFALHAELATDPAADWHYRRLATHAGTLAEPTRADGPRLGWTGPDVSLRGRIGSTETTAQVDPGAFSRGMMRAAGRRGAKLRLGDVTGVLRCGNRVTGVETSGERIEGDAVVVAMGPWSLLASRWLPLPPVYGLKGHSILFETGDEIGDEALFLECREASGEVLTPEVFPRADGTTYVCAISSESPLPLDPRRVEPDEGAIDRLLHLCRRISPALAPDRVRAAQACFRPITQDGLPIIGEVPGTPGAYVATGHGVWGILNAPATGEAMAELILDGAARSVDLTRFAPGRLSPANRTPVRRVVPTPS